MVGGQESSPREGEEEDIIEVEKVDKVAVFLSDDSEEEEEPFYLYTDLQQLHQPPPGMNGRSSEEEGEGLPLLLSGHEGQNGHGVSEGVVMMEE